MKNIGFAVGLAAVAVGTAAVAQQEGFVEFRALAPASALALAQAALASCHDSGFQVAVAVVDRFGQTQVVLRDQFAGPHTVDTAVRKAWTAVSFRAKTTELDALSAPGAVSYGIRMIEGALPLGGGVPVEAGGSIVAGIGVSGAPEPSLDETCAEAGIVAIDDLLHF